MWFYFILCHTFTQRWTTDWRLSEAMGAALVGNSKAMGAIPLKISSHIKKKKCFKLLRPGWASSDCSLHRLENALCLLMTFQCRRAQAAPRAWRLILPSTPSITFWNSLQRDCQMTITGKGSNLDSNLNSGYSATWPTSCKGFIASETTLSINCVEFEFF